MLYYGKLYHKSGDPPMDMLFIYGFDRSYTGLSVPVNQTVYLYRPGGR